MTSILAPPISLSQMTLDQNGMAQTSTERDVPQALRPKHDESEPGVKQEPDERGRARRRSRTYSKESESAVQDGTEGNEDPASEQDNPSRKRRRSRKGLDKKFECPHAGCGKSYSRAEHLYRHQLNHTPKQIYRCDFPDCERAFVRQDLCNRHRERHTARNSQLQTRRDSMSTGLTMSVNVTPKPERHNSNPAHTSISPEMLRTSMSDYRARPHLQQSPSAGSNSSPFSPITTQSSTTFAVPDQPTANDYANHQRRNSFARPGADGHGQTARPEFGNHLEPQQQAKYTAVDTKMMNAEYSRPVMQNNNGAYALYPNPLSAHPDYHPHLAHVNSHPDTHTSYTPQQNFTAFALPPPGYDSMAVANPSHDNISTNAISAAHPTLSTADSREASSAAQSGSDMVWLDQMAATNTMPVFGSEGYNRSPFAIPDDFLAYLFNQPYENQNSGFMQTGMGQAGYANHVDAINQYQPYFSHDTIPTGFFPQTASHPMAVTSLLDTTLPETILSEEKSQEIIDLIKERFNETDHSPVAKQKETLLDGDRNDESHMMSRKMMQTYIGSFWWHFHPQLPILHKPTFSPDKTHHLLLIAMMAIGASCLDKTHGWKVTQAGAELSNFLAWHLRWEIFSDVSFRPPAKLWVFQALLLLELYEKMYSTRALHERAHIHHATTITLMRRGSSLIGRSALDSPPSVREDKQGVNGSRHSSTSGVNTPDEWWNHWITNEATRRAAFAAFVLDSTHATMFGHSTVMVAHEMRLPLPCDESLWSSTNSAEVGRLESNLHASGNKPISFLEGLKKTLNGQEIRTNSFGRTILMSGLLSVSWHMNQRDLQVNSLGVQTALGGRDKWRGSLTRAFDMWKADFDRSLTKGNESIPGPYTYAAKQDETIVFESRTVLHHLAHMAMHVDIVDCQIFARAKRLLGRTIGSSDLNSAQRRMKDWAPTAKARDATYYALQFLSSVLLPEDAAPSRSTSVLAHYSPPVSELHLDYSARDDVLLNRPWVVYFAALIVWSYAFALEGPPAAASLPANASFDDHVRDMNRYLRTLGGVHSPEDLKLQRGFNSCASLLVVLRSTFEKTRWELLHEAANLLDNCIALVGGQV